VLPLSIDASRCTKTLISVISCFLWIYYKRHKDVFSANSSTISSAALYCTLFSFYPCISFFYFDILCRLSLITFHRALSNNLVCIPMRVSSEFILIEYPNIHAASCFFSSLHPTMGCCFIFLLLTRFGIKHQYRFFCFIIINIIDILL